MKISLCVPCMNRTHDLKIALPAMLESLRRSAPGELSIVNYNSKDDLADFILSVVPPEGVELIYRKYEGRDSFHMAHARNLSVLNSTGGPNDYIAIGSADMVPDPEYFTIARKMAEDGCLWMQEVEHKGFIVVRRDEFIDSGGYDERFEFYGPEDRDIALRLFRRATGRFGRIPAGHITLIRTRKRDKLTHYRSGYTREEMARYGAKIAELNFIKYTLVANQSTPWGQWT